MKKLGIIWCSSLILKLVLAAVLPLSSDEAYYWVWSMRPQLSYYDHPPFVAWLFKLGQFVDLWGHSVRWPGVVLGHLTLLVWMGIWRRLHPNSGSQKTQWWLALALCSPLLGFGSLVITPDLPVVFFWSLSLYFTIRILQKQSTFDYAFLGVSLGLGFCSKYHIVLFVPFLLAFILFEKKWNEVRWSKVFWVFLFGLAFSSPVLIWNFQHDFISFRFQLAHGFSRPHYNPYWTWTYVAAQAALLFPTVVWCALRARLSGISRLFFYFGWGPLVFFLLSSFKALVEANWPIVAYPAFFAMAVYGAKNSRPFWIANLFWVSVFAILLSQTYKPWIPTAPEKLSELTQFEPILSKRNDYEPLYASTYQMASWVWYESKVPFFKLKGMSRWDIFDTFPEGQPNQFPIYIAMKRETPMPPWIETHSPPLRVHQVESLQNDFVIVKVEP